MVKINKKNVLKVVKKVAKNKQIRKFIPPAAQDYIEHEATLLGLTDPFSPEAAGARYPDSGAGETITFQQRVSNTLGTVAVSGNAALCYNPRANFPYLQHASIAGNVVTWQATWTGDVSTNLVNTYAKSYRPTSLGVRVSNLLSATDSKGYIVVAKGPPPNLGGATTADPGNFTDWDTHPLSHGFECHTTSHPRGGNGYDFKAITLTQLSNTVADDTWECLYFFVFGAPASTTMLLHEAFINYEFTTIPAAPIAQMAQRQPVLNTHMQTAVNEVQSSIGSSHKGGTHIVRGKLKSEAKKALLKHVLPFVARKAKMALL